MTEKKMQFLNGHPFSIDPDANTSLVAMKGVFQRAHSDFIVRVPGDGSRNLYQGVVYIKEDHIEVIGAFMTQVVSEKVSFSSMNFDDLKF